MRTWWIVACAGVLAALVLVTSLSNPDVPSSASALDEPERAVAHSDGVARLDRQEVIQRGVHSEQADEARSVHRGSTVEPAWPLEEWSRAAKRWLAPELYGDQGAVTCALVLQSIEERDERYARYRQSADSSLQDLLDEGGVLGLSEAQLMQLRDIDGPLLDAVADAAINVREVRMMSALQHIEDGLAPEFVPEPEALHPDRNSWSRHRAAPGECRINLPGNTRGTTRTVILTLERDATYFAARRDLHDKKLRRRASLIAQLDGWGISQDLGLK